VIAPCAVHVPVHRIPAHVVVIRAGRRLSRPLRAGKPGGLFLQRGDHIRVSAPGSFTFTLEGNRYRVEHGALRVDCRRLLLGPSRTRRTTVLALRLQSGRVDVRAGAHARRALVLSPEMLTLATLARTRFVIERDPSARRTRAWTLGQPIAAAKASDQSLRITSRLTYTAIADASGLRLDVWPFSISKSQRAARPADRLVPFWADGLPCSVGCTAPGAIPGWPIRPFHRQHALRAGINELRPANFHVGVDIEAQNGAAVYPIQSGYVHIRYQGTGDVNVDVGQFDYWHIHPTVREGQFARAYATRLGNVLYDFKHLALSEGQAQYLNPLRPGGSLSPYRDTEPPIIGLPRIYAGGRVIVRAFDPQSYVERASYETPVLAPAALAWRLYDARGHALTELEWALRGSQNYPPALKPVIFGPGAANPGYACFAFRVLCIPNWTYWLAGGLTEPLPLGRLGRGHYRLTVYAWDWSGNTSALDDRIRIPFVRAAQAPSGALRASFETA
jgi:hypothetical protein